MRSRQILGFLGLTLWVTACGQQGALVLPTEAAAQGRATLPQTLLPTPVASAPSTAASRPLRP